VVFDYRLYLGAKWHHGQPISWADILYSLYQTFDLAYDPEKSKIEVALATVSKPYLQLFKGFRIINGTALEVYLDFWHFDPNYIAEYAQLAGLSMPWEVLAAMDELVFVKRQAAYSDTAAARFGVPWINLVMDKDSRLVKLVLTEFLAKGRLPEGVFEAGGRSYVSAEEAEARYKAAIRWIDEHGNAVISNGPFYLNRYDPPAQSAELLAFRDPSYPFKPGSWFKGVTEGVVIEEIAGTEVPLGEEARVELWVSGLGELGARYVITDPATGELVRVGEAEPVQEGLLVITLPPSFTAKLREGAYQLDVVAYSTAVARVAERTTLLRTYTPTEVTETTETTVSVTETVETTTETTVTAETTETEVEATPTVTETTTVATTTETIETATTTTTPTPPAEAAPTIPIAGVAAGLIVVVLLVAFVAWRRRRA
jgi:peptide/nickel transport system substrate-binding protein